MSDHRKPVSMVKGKYFFTKIVTPIVTTVLQLPKNRSKVNQPIIRKNATHKDFEKCILFFCFSYSASVSNDCGKHLVD